MVRNATEHRRLTAAASPLLAGENNARSNVSKDLTETAVGGNDNRSAALTQLNDEVTVDALAGLCRRLFDFALSRG